MRYQFMQFFNLGEDRYMTGDVVEFDEDTNQVLLPGGKSYLGYRDVDGNVVIYPSADCSHTQWLPLTVDITALIGASIIAVEGMTARSSKVRILTSVGELVLQHHHHCCETVELVDVCGDPEDLIDGIVVVCEVRKGNRSNRVKRTRDWANTTPTERLAWRVYTFYEIRTTKGDVTMRWGEPDRSDDNRYGEEITATFIPL